MRNKNIRIISLFTFAFALAAAAVAAPTADALNRFYEQSVKNEKGRVLWHGNRVTKVTDVDNGVTISTYADGTVFRDPCAETKTAATEAEKLNAKIASLTNGVPEKLAQLRVRAAKEKGRTNVVTRVIN